MKVTTVKLYKSTKSALDSLRSERESYDEVISNVDITICKRSYNCSQYYSTQIGSIPRKYSSVNFKMNNGAVTNGI